MIFGFETVSEQGSKSKPRKGFYFPGFHVARKQIHLSVDDVIEVFRNLSAESLRYQSIFENPELAWFLDLHQRYGAKISGYCFYRSGDFTLSDCPDQYRSEFESNSDWLRFSFHALDAEKRYPDEKSDELIADCRLIKRELERIVGAKAITNTVRLHYFEGSYKALETLSKEDRVYAFLSADDRRNSYYLSKSESRHLYCNEEYYDKDTNVRFYSTDLRAELIDDIEDKLNELKSPVWNNQRNILVVFTHEWALLGDETVKQKVDEICRYARDKQYEFSFLEMPIFDYSQG